ncbi:MAG: hypothetical protein JKY37_10205 [Nannocystaceae bacterium]|nr:hypothetical protein [Nannocystaceae bacterium]
MTPDHVPAPISSAPTVSADCVLAARRVEPPPLHDDLLKVAPQYFHAHHRGGFDAYTGGSSFPWFDVHQLDRAIQSPPGARISASTRTMLFPVKLGGGLGLLARGGGPTTWLGEKLYPEEAVDSGSGTSWVLARSGSTWRVVQLDADRQVTILDLKIPETSYEVRIAVTDDGRPALAWLTRDGGRLQVRLAMDFLTADLLTTDFNVATSTVVDEVEVPTGVAELSHRTRANLALAPNGPDEIAVAWRPLVDQDYTDFGDRSTPPSTSAAA